MVLIISNVYAGFFEGVQNPHGRPGLLSIKYSDILFDGGRNGAEGHGATQFMSYSNEMADEPWNLNITLPITNFLTIGWERFSITNSYAQYEQYVIEHIGPNGESYNSFSYDGGEFGEFYNYTPLPPEIAFVNLKKIHLELHIPLYKIWEK